MPTWLLQSFLAAALLVPVWLGIGFFDKNFQMKPEVFLVWYFLGVALASACFSVSSLKELAPSSPMIFVLFCFGVVAGGIANIAIFRAVVSAPNPGLPVAIANTASVGVFLLAALLSRFFPNYFSPVKVDITALMGIFLTVLGISLIAIRK